VLICVLVVLTVTKHESSKYSLLLFVCEEHFIHHVAPKLGNNLID